MVRPWFDPTVFNRGRLVQWLGLGLTRLLEGRAGPWGLSSQILHFSDENPGSQRDQ